MALSMDDDAEAGDATRDAAPSRAVDAVLKRNPLEFRRLHSRSSSAARRLSKVTGACGFAARSILRGMLRCEDAHACCAAEARAALARGDAREARAWLALALAAGRDSAALAERALAAGLTEARRLEERDAARRALAQHDLVTWAGASEPVGATLDSASARALDSASVDAGGADSGGDGGAVALDVAHAHEGALDGGAAGAAIDGAGEGGAT